MEQQEPKHVKEIEYNEDLQLAENVLVDEDQDQQSPTAEEKRVMLEKTKIVKQTWSIQEIYQKIKSNRLDLSPDYQRNDIWKNDKQTAFIESLFMGIIVPPIYVVEVPGDDPLEDSKYEVVDGKQRLTAINKFLTNQLELDKKSLEYYKDWFSSKKYSEIREQYGERTSEMLSSVLDIYVITANSPEFTKYDIFSRLNKGAEKLKVNEIRKAIYRSPLLDQIDRYVKNFIKTEGLRYSNLFSANDMKRYEDYGRFYTSVAFYYRSNLETGEVDGYNSRPRDMINIVLQQIQNKDIVIPEEKVQLILDKTMELLERFKGVDGGDYIINACIPFLKQNLYDRLIQRIDTIIHDEKILDTLEKSPATTSHVNDRLKRVKEILEGDGN